ncbi:hypothetical protein AGLY_001884, partial [Aphis glycines]
MLMSVVSVYITIFCISVYSSNFYEICRERENLQRNDNDLSQTILNIRYYSKSISRRYLNILPNLNVGVFRPLKHKPPFSPTTGNYILVRGQPRPLMYSRTVPTCPLFLFETDTKNEQNKKQLFLIDCLKYISIRRSSSSFASQNYEQRMSNREWFFFEVEFPSNSYKENFSVNIRNKQ